MELLKQVALEFAIHQMDERALLFEHPQYQAVPKKYKLPAGIAVAAALGATHITTGSGRTSRIFDSVR